MSDNTQEALLAALRDLLDPLVQASASEDLAWGLFGELGWSLEAILGPNSQAFLQDLSAVAGAVTAIERWQTTPPQTLADLQGALRTVSAAVTAAANLPAAIAGVHPAGLDQLASELMDHLVSRYLVDHHLLLHRILVLLGVIQPVTVAAVTTTTDVVRSNATLSHVNWNQIANLLTDPVGTLKNMYSPGGTATQVEADAVADLLFPLVAEVLGRAGADAVAGLGASLPQVDPDEIAVLEHMLTAIWMFAGPDGVAAETGFTARILGGDNGGPGLFVAPFAGAGFEWANSGWLLDGSVSGQVDGLLIQPGGAQFLATGPTSQLSLQLSLATSGTDPATHRLGSVTGTRLELGQAALTVSATFGADQDYGFLLEATSAAIVVAAADGDGFLAAILPRDGVRTVFDLGIGWSAAKGLYIKGGIGLDATLPVHVAVLGVLTIDTVHLRLGTSGSDITATASATAQVKLGPITASIDRVGLSAIIGFPPGGGNAGPADLTLGFKLPDGLGLGLSAPPVSGTGFLSYSAADGRYLGVVALSIGDVAVSAVGVLDTRLPGGAAGYSLIVLASALFPPVQLGFGFSLSGVGGLVAVNRTADVPSLQALARAGRLDDLMFPADLLHRAPQVAANLGQQFPAAPGHFIVGPAVQVQWGAGGMVHADIGVLIELTDSGGGITVLRVALLGLVHLTLPGAAAPVADITLDVLGVADFAAKTLSLDAGLRKSTIAGFPLTGQAALRAGWGDNPQFLFAAGGFNPHFAAPAGFPALQRIALAIGGGDSPRLRLSAYLALTSNTLQLGCAADLYASVRVAGVTAAVAASLSFDALVQFQPFGLIVDLTIAAAILVNGSPVLTMGVDLHVTGPDPWTVTGQASFGFLWFTITVPISITAGPAPLPQPAQTADLDGNLLTALADPRSWAAGPPAGRGLVRVRGQGAAGTAVHPLGSLTVRQHAVPLGQRIERYGPDLLDAACRYDITGTGPGGQGAAGTAVTDFFAPAQFLTMTDADKLSSPSFETMTAGTTIGTAPLTVPPAPGTAPASATVADTVSAADWDTLTLDSPDPAPPPPASPAPPPASPAAAPAGPAPVPVPVSPAPPATTSVPAPVLAAQLGGAAAALAVPAGQDQASYASPGIGIAVQAPLYAITGLNLAAPATATAISSWHLPSLTAGLTTAAQAGYQHNWQVIYTSEVP